MENEGCRGPRRALSASPAETAMGQEARNGDQAPLFLGTILFPLCTVGAARSVWNWAQRPAASEYPSRQHNWRGLNWRSRDGLTLIITSR